MSVTVVYRSAADLKKAEFWYEEGPKMQERAINAEGEVERLRLMVKSITGGLDEAIETVHFLEDEVERLKTENAKLRAATTELLEVVEILHPNMNPDEPCVVYEAWEQGKQALAELDEEEG